MKSTKQMSFKKILLITSLVMTFIVLLNPMQAKAALNPTTEIKQTYGSESLITVGWNKVIQAYGYCYQYTDDSKCMSDPSAVVWTNEEVTTGLETSVYNLNSGKTYFFRICSLATYNDPSRAWSNPVEMNTAPAADGKTVTQVGCTKNSLDYTWPAIEGATGYDVCLKSSNGEYVYYASTQTPAVTITGLPDNSSSEVRVYPYRTSAHNSFKAEHNWMSSDMGLTLPTKPIDLRVSNRDDYYHKTALEFTSTTKMNNISGYEIQIVDAAGKKITKAETSGAEKCYISNKKLFTRPFQFRVRSFMVLNSKRLYSDWTNYKRYIPGAPVKVIKLASNKKSGTLNWSKVTGATNYTVYWKTSSNSKWKCVAKNVKGTSAKVKFDKKATYNYYYVRTNKVKFGKKKYTGLAAKEELDVYQMASWACH